MSAHRCWGIFRERTHSPGRESDDAEILRLTAKELEARGFTVSVKSPDELDDPAETPPPAIFLMCERVRVLRTLCDWEATGVRLVNPPVAVLNTYRERMLALWAAAGVPFPASRVVRTDGPPPPERESDRWPIWVKRADVHNTQQGDVSLIQDRAALHEALMEFARRGLQRAVLQQDVAGDLLKFYGIGTAPGPDGDAPWFRYFYHRDQVLHGHPFDPPGLARLTRKAAAVLGLEVFGGDAIVRPDGHLTLIDLNAWPSFALYRDEAAAEIAGYLARRFTRG
jgi:hypothetical protein